MCVRSPSSPLTHISVGRSRPGGVHVEANTGMAGLARGATPASNVEGHRAKVALFDELDVVAALDDLSSDLVAENHVAARKGRSAADHVLVAAADVRAHHLEDDTVVALSLLALGHDRARRAVELQLWEGDVLRAVRATSGQARCVLCGWTANLKVAKFSSYLDLNVIGTHEDNAAVSSGRGRVPPSVDDFEAREAARRAGARLWVLDLARDARAGEAVLLHSELGERIRERGAALEEARRRLDPVRDT